MRNTPALTIALASGAMLLMAACSKDADTPKETATASPEAPADVTNEAKTSPSTAAPSDTPSTGAPEPKAPAAK